MTSLEQKVVPHPDFCVVLAGYGLKQEGGLFYWVDSGIADKDGKTVWSLLEADSLCETDVKPGTRGCFRAPTINELVAVTPSQYFVSWGRFAFLFVDLFKSEVRKEVSQDGKVTNISVIFSRIKEADAPDVADCYAKGLCYLLMEKRMSFEPVPLTEGVKNEEENTQTPKS